MTPQEMVAYWIKTANDDWKTVHHLFDTRDYAYSLFFAHLYLEKLLKAIIVQRTGATAPFGHRLRVLAETGALALTSDQIIFLERVNEYNIKTRYPDWNFEFKKRVTRKFCEQELKEIEGFGKWLKSILKS